MTTAAKLLQKEFAAYNDDRRVKTLVVDVYSDRLNVVGDSRWIQAFFERRGVVADRDRGGYSIDIKDAAKLGMPVEVGTYDVPRDARKNWVKR